MFPFICSDCGKSIANYEQIKKHRKKCSPAALDSSSQQETELCVEQVLFTAHLVARHSILLLGVVVVPNWTHELHMCGFELDCMYHYNSSNVIQIVDNEPAKPVNEQLLPVFLYSWLLTDPASHVAAMHDFMAASHHLINRPGVAGAVL